MGLVLAATNAAAGTALLVYYFLWPDQFSGPGPGWVALTIVSGGLLSAWVAAWAWRSERWGVAGPALVLSLWLPWGYFVVIAGPVVLGLATVAGVRAHRQRRRPVVRAL